MKKKLIASVAILASVGFLSLTRPMDKPTPIKQDSVKTVVAKQETTKATVSTVQAAPVVPETTPPVVETPQTPVDWWKAQKEFYSEDEMSCFLSIVLIQNIPTDSSPEVLNQTFNYAIDNYGSTCRALARLSNVPSQY